MPDSVADLRRRYVLGCRNGKWRSSIAQSPSEGRRPSRGLIDAVNIDNFDTEKQQEFDNRWLAGALSEEAYRKYVQNTSNSSWKWAQNFGDADNWDL